MIRRLLKARDHKAYPRNNHIPLPPRITSWFPHLKFCFLKTSMMTLVLVTR